MYRVLIVDDEALETDGLSRALRSAYGEGVRLETAHNGKAAIAVAETFRPDIILMDIEMPGINGLEAAKIIREAQPRCRIVIITAYERFQYAQMAISLGAEDYLLKPMRNEELYRVIEKVMADIDRDRADAGRYGALDQLAREQFVLSILSGYASVASLQRQLQELGIAFAQGLFFAAKAENSANMEEAASLLDPFFHEIPGLQRLHFVYDGTLYLLLLFEVGHDTLCIDAMRSAVAALRAGKCKSLLVGAGPAVTELGELQRACSLSAEMLALASAAGPLRIAPAEAGREGAHTGLERKLHGYLLDRDLDAALRCVEMIFDTLFSALEQPEAVLDVARDVIARVGTALQQDARLSDEARFQGNQLGAPLQARQEMQDAAKAVIRTWIGAIEAPEDTRLHRIRAEIERYLLKHYTEELSISRVAREMHYSEPYFSKLFSRCFHKNFVTYLTDIRMQAAKEMLVASEANVREVSAAVGFADANYFTKVFRKAYGVSPSEYRRYLSAREGALDG